jgi:hypothetical protein
LDRTPGLVDGELDPFHLDMGNDGAYERGERPGRVGDLDDYSLAGSAGAPQVITGGDLDLPEAPLFGIGGVTEG